jgi:hypothetical protein
MSYIFSYYLSRAISDWPYRLCEINYALYNAKREIRSEGHRRIQGRGGGEGARPHEMSEKIKYNKKICERNGVK